MPTRRSRSSRDREPAPLKHPATGELATAFGRVVEIATRLPGTVAAHDGD